MTPDDLATIIKKALEEALRDRGTVNVLIAGRTGVGKSTLINAVFQGDLATTGQGRPVTRDTREITKEGVPLTVFDTRGLELAAFQETIDGLQHLIRERSRDRDASRHIHVAWLCIQEDGRRVEQAETELHRILNANLPVIGVVTKARADHGFRAEVQRLLPDARQVVRVRAIADTLDDGHTLPPMGLAELVLATSEVIPEGQRRAFAASQKASVEYTKRIAHGIVATGAAAAATAGASPIPFSDALLLVPIQVVMLASLTAVFGLDLSVGFLTTLVGSALGSAGSTLVGRTIAANLLKLVPGGGTAAGAVISAATAATLTTALGEIYLATLAGLFVDNGGTPPSPDAIAREFKRRLSLKAAEQ